MEKLQLLMLEGQSREYMVGLLAPDSGSVRINGYNLEKAPIQLKRSIGYVPDSSEVYEKLIVIVSLVPVYSLLYLDFLRLIYQACEWFARGTVHSFNCRL